jgi:APA family basic amino acid/polyamine antiporter
VTCLAGTLFCVAMAGSLPADTWIRLVIWAVIGILIYFFYSRHHSKLRQQNSAR